MGLFQRQDKPMPLAPNRFLQFFYLIKENFLLLFYTSITHFIFSLPLIYILLSTYTKYSIMINSETLDKTKLYQTLINGGIWIIPTMIILSIATTGMINIVKQISYNEATSYTDFFIGIKNYYLKLLPIIIIDAIFSSLPVINYAIYLFTDINATFKLVSLIISIIMFIMIKISKSFYITQKLIFENSTIQIIRNCAIFTLNKIFRNIMIFLLANILTILLFFLPEQMRIIDIVIIIILGGAYSNITTHLNTLNVIESFITKQTYPTIYHKGLVDFYKTEQEL